MTHVHNIKSQRTYNSQYGRRWANNTLRLKKKIFPPICDYKLDKIQIDSESYMYISYDENAQAITKLIGDILINIPCSDNEMTKIKDISITDMTAGVGGNVLNFSKNMKSVTAIEINPIRYNNLINNISLYECSNVLTFNEDAIDWLENNDCFQDVIFIDPPWGGKRYKSFDKLRLSLGKFQLEDLVDYCFKNNRAKLLVLKLPTNYDFDHIKNALSSYKIFFHNIERMTIVIISNYQ